MYFVPGGPMLETSQKAVKRYHSQTLAQRVSHWLGIRLEEHVAFLKQEELDTAELLKRLRIPNRPNALVPPTFPPYFGSVDRERRTRMTESCAQPGPLQTRVREGWIPLFTPPPPPTYIPREQFLGWRERRDRKAFCRHRGRRGENFARVAAKLSSLGSPLTDHSRNWKTKPHRVRDRGIVC